MMQATYIYSRRRLQVVLRKLSNEKLPSLEEIIDKGGEVALDKSSDKRWCNFTLRVRMDMLVEIGKQIEDRPGVSKTVWILEAIQEKIKKNKTKED